MKKSKVKGDTATKAVEWLNGEICRNVTDMLNRDGILVEVSPYVYGFQNKTEMVSKLDGSDCLRYHLYAYDASIQNHILNYHHYVLFLKDGSKKIRACDKPYTLNRKTKYMKIELAVEPEFGLNNESFYRIKMKVNLDPKPLLEKFDDFAVSGIFDAVGHPINVGDHIVFSTHTNSFIDVGVVTKLGDVMVTIENGVKVHSKKSCVIPCDKFVEEYMKQVHGC